MEQFLLDTNILIKYLRRDTQAQLCVNQGVREHLVNTSFVCFLELLEGARSKNQLAGVEILENLIPIDFGSTSINRSALLLYKSYYLNKGLDSNDAIIACTCLENNYTLVSENLKDFDFVPNLKVISLENWSRLSRI